MPVIVAFGDSNAWGYDPATGGRFPRPQRWPSVLQRELGADFEVIAARGAGEARGGRRRRQAGRKLFPGREEFLGLEGPKCPKGHSFSRSRQPKPTSGRGDKNGGVRGHEGRRRRLVARPGARA